MRTLDEILTQRKTNCIDGRDTYRLYKFIPWSTLQKYPEVMEGIKEEYLNEEKWNAEVYEAEYTRENILAELKRDLAFGFQKALDKRGISSGLMFEVVKMWNWVLNDDETLANWTDSNYAMYGLPLFKATAVYYGFPNEIGDDNGDESWYNEDYDDDDLYYQD